MRIFFTIVFIFIFLPNSSFSGEYSDLLKRSKTKNSNKLLKVIDETIKGLEFGRSYFVDVQSPNNKIKLYVARSFIDSGNNIKLNAPDGDWTRDPSIKSRML